MTVAEKVKTLMARKGINMGRMAELTGQSRQNLSNKMSRGDFQESDIAKMAAALGLSVEIYFIDENGDILL